MLRLTFRLKLLVTLGIASLGFVVLIVSGLIITERVSRQLIEIQEQYVPLVELRPQLEGMLEQLGRSFQDAVATQDVEALTTAATLKSNFLEKLGAAESAMDEQTAAALRQAIEKYYAAAYDVSLRLMNGDTGVAAVDAMADMQQKHAQVLATLQQATVFNKETLSGAFELVENALRSADDLRLALGIAFLTMVTLLSFWLTREMLQSLTRLSWGLGRFGKGNFAEPIQINRQDEFGDVAVSANRMAKQITELLRDRDRKSDELSAANAMLAMTNRELEAFSYSVSHDLRAPLRAIDGFSRALLAESGPNLNEQGRHYLERVRAGTQRMSRLIDDLLNLSRITRGPLVQEPFDLSELAKAAAAELQAREPSRKVSIEIQENLQARGDPRLIRVVLENLLGNAYKFTSKKPDARIFVGCENIDGRRVYLVRDNGAGFDMANSSMLFGAFQRLHSDSEFEGTGIGLATVQRIIHRHGGKVWAEGIPDQGATFYFTLGGE